MSVRRRLHGFRGRLRHPSLMPAYRLFRFPVAAALATALIVGCTPSGHSDTSSCPLRPFRQSISFDLTAWKPLLPFAAIACTDSFRCLRQHLTRGPGRLHVEAAYRFTGQGNPRVKYSLRLIGSGRDLLRLTDAVVVPQDREGACGNYGGMAVVSVRRDGTTATTYVQ